MVECQLVVQLELPKLFALASVHELLNKESGANSNADALHQSLDIY